MNGPNAPPELVLEHSPGQRAGSVCLIVRLGDHVVYADELKITKAQDRKQFVERLCESHPGIDSAELKAELLHIVGDLSRGSEEPKRSQATVLVQLAREAELFHTPGSDAEAYATVPVGTHKETHKLNSRSFKRWLRRACWQQHSGAPAAQALQDAIGVLDGQALFNGSESAVFVRIAEQAGAIWIDLGDATHRAVKITASGWQVVADPPVKFRRTRGILPLPEPVQGGCLGGLRSFLNVESDEDWMLVVGWLVAVLRPTGPFPVLVVNGEQGSCKSTLCRVLRALVDPNSAPVRSGPRDARDLMITANNSWLLAFDNLSHLSPWLSDAICRLATGGAFATRALYTDADEILFDSQRPVLLNGIEELAARGDLLDRSICLTMPNLSESDRRTEAEFWSAFEGIRPQVLGGLLV